MFSLSITKGNNFLQKAFAARDLLDIMMSNTVVFASLQNI